MARGAVATVEVILEVAKAAVAALEVAGAVVETMAVAARASEAKVVRKGGSPEVE